MLDYTFGDFKWLFCFLILGMAKINGYFLNLKDGEVLRYTIKFKIEASRTRQISSLGLSLLK